MFYTLLIVDDDVELFVMYSRSFGYNGLALRYELSALFSFRSSMDLLCAYSSYMR